ncbi:uncharacterized protein V6R79_024274 [Siganus canaliculatus]
MKTTIQCIILLACIAICSSVVIRNCRCVKTISGLDPKLIEDVKLYPPRAYCNKEEVIVMLTNKSSRCLDPAAAFTKMILRIKQRSARMAKLNASRSKPAGTPAAPTSSEASSTSQRGNTELNKYLEPRRVEEKRGRLQAVQTDARCLDDSVLWSPTANAPLLNLAEASGLSLNSPSHDYLLLHM